LSQSGAVITDKNKQTSTNNKWHYLVNLLRARKKANLSWLVNHAFSAASQPI